MTRPSLLACLILSGLLAACQPRPEPAASAPVSYTHLTLPTICSV